MATEKSNKTIPSETWSEHDHEDFVEKCQKGEEKKRWQTSLQFVSYISNLRNLRIDCDDRDIVRFRMIK